MAARGAGERGRRCWQLRRALPARPGRTGSEMPGAQASVGRHQAAVGSGQEAPERTVARRPPAAADPPVPRRSVRGAIRSSRASDLSESRCRCYCVPGGLGRYTPERCEPPTSSREPPVYLPGLQEAELNLAVNASWTGACESSSLQHPCWLWLLHFWGLALGINVFLNRFSVAISSTRVA